MNVLHHPSASFEQPLDMLLACHDKIRRFCRQLEALPAHLAAHGMDAATAQALAQIRRYFQQAAPLHHADEEQDFFPLLLRHHPPARADVDALAAEHSLLHNAWAALDAHLAALLAGQATVADAALITRYSTAYARHMAVEESWFHRAGDLLPAVQLQTIGQRMAARRQAA